MRRRTISRRGYNYYYQNGFSPSLTNLLAWYDPFAASTMYQDDAFTTAADIGDPVGGYKNKISSNYHASQSGVTAKPTRQVGYLDFDGTDYLEIPGLPSLYAGSAFSIFLAEYRTGGAAPFAQGNNANLTNSLRLQQSTTTANAYAFDPVLSYSDGLSASDNQWNVRSLRRNGTTYKFRINSTSNEKTSSVAPTLNTSAIGAWIHTGVSFHFTGRIGTILIYDRELTDDDAQATLQWMSDLHGGLL